MAKYGNDRQVEAFGQRVLHEALIEGRSLLDGRPIWTQDNFAELQQRYTQQPDESGDTFDTKLQHQFEGAPSDVWQLFAELYVVDLSVIGNVRASTKVAKVEAVLRRCTPPLALTGEKAPEGARQVAEMFENGGVLNGGQGYNAARWKQMRYLVEFGARWFALDAGERRRRIEDPDTLATTLEELVPAELSEKQIVKAMRYLLMPSRYVPVCSSGHLSKITNYYADYIPPELADAPPQRQAAGISDAVRHERGISWSLYSERELWGAPRAHHLAAQAAERARSVDPIDEAAEAAGDTTPDGEVAELPHLTSEDADALLVDLEWLHRVRRLLARRRQLVLQGPPGTGKTFLARQLGKLFTGSAERVHLVQFHPAYTYEDFFEGFRPVEDGSLQLRHGPLRRIADEATENPDQNYVLVIDEINRGNLARIFGELYFLLEYRDHEVELMYSQQPFSLPKNLYVLATMNSADRSIALVDGAMRRRFGFLPLEPESQPTAGLLGRWLARTGGSSEVELLWAELNRRIRERDGSAQIGPSYFMDPELTGQDSAAPDEGLLVEVWATEILPQLRESFVGAEDWVDSSLTLEAVRSVVRP